MIAGKEALWKQLAASGHRVGFHLGDSGELMQVLGLDHRNQAVGRPRSTELRSPGTLEMV